MYDFYLLKNESLNSVIDISYHIDYQVNKGKVFVWFVMLF